MTELTQLNVRVPVALKTKLKKRAKEEGTKLEAFIEDLLKQGLDHQQLAEAAKEGLAGDGTPESPFKTKKAARDDWDRQLKLLPPEMRDAWKEENPRP
jgi:hypothetical protein